MKKNYKLIQFEAGERIDSAMEKLKRQDSPASGLFNGKMLYSDESIDSAYKKITGKTKCEFDAQMKAENEQRDKEEREHKSAILELTKEWIKKGNKILDEKYHELWTDIVPIRLRDLYRGMELGASLEIIKQLNNGCTLDTAKKTIEGQGHSGMSFGLVCSMVKDLCDRGNEFVNYVKP